MPHIHAPRTPRTRRRAGLRRPALAAPSVAAWLLAPPLAAQDVTVTVSRGADGSSDRLEGATVCLGSASDRAAHGSDR